jgi:hypothetical protein
MRTMPPDARTMRGRAGQPETGGRGLVASGAILRILAAVREVRIMVGSPTRAAEVRAVVNTAAEVQLGARVPVVTAKRYRSAGSLDDVAGCEFVDDRLRLRD